MRKGRSGTVVGVIINLGDEGVMGDFQRWCNNDIHNNSLLCFFNTLWVVLEERGEKAMKG